MGGGGGGGGQTTPLCFPFGGMPCSSHFECILNVSVLQEEYAIEMRGC